uniref:Uncharacterized protein n=1 Tax=Arundo donax TaxID=35708 RepID=A0A0A9BST5_ARUDO
MISPCSCGPGSCIQGNNRCSVFFNLVFFRVTSEVVGSLVKQLQGLQILT